MHIGLFDIVVRAVVDCYNGYKFLYSILAIFRT